MQGKRTLEERFWAKVQKTDDCWLWTGFILSGGYGQFHVPDLGPVRAHRFSYELHVGPIPRGMQIDHLCRNRGCVNPAHLEVVTPRENIMRGVNHVAENARKTHCKRGHPLEGDNLRLYHGMRNCRACEKLYRDTHDFREYKHEWYLKNKDKYKK